MKKKKELPKKKEIVVRKSNEINEAIYNILTAEQYKLFLLLIS